MLFLFILYDFMMIWTYLSSTPQVHAAPEMKGIRS